MDVRKKTQCPKLIKEESNYATYDQHQLAASAANYYLSRNQSALQKSLTKLSSGSRIIQPWTTPEALQSP